ncbi:hypothetical protein H2O64_21280 [Kordia sp. YSTF-M3]|uniref:Uncharacterized protein n=1 Tax=Kordia aestuariivivens TaxID=2759037 RepID=A0ABR7QF63_9FLAO|nr:hypothetical protein [Kordia aestuariivivens]MBC8757216.1 hypothetical protein [Kordia aestuariivivens]
MENKNTSTIWYVIGVILIAISLYFFVDSYGYTLKESKDFLNNVSYEGMNKKFVEGDAYNYIIAGTYSTTMMLRSVVFAIIGCTFLLLSKTK